MRPIKLRIKGLNSFIEEQIIDFNKLTSRGLFGIFGPTGSGKSTVLDGITLALYGEVARKSSNFINTNCATCHVSFEFSISGNTTKRYKVQREYKSDKKTGNPRSNKCKLIDLTNDKEEVISDKAKEITNKCIDIIGLNLDDFTRTVVLPQGRFSEFLKLSGKDRRDMLERLFNLHKYGDELTSKLLKQLSIKKAELTYLDGQLNGYEDINDENLLKLNEQLLYIQKEYDIKNNTYNKLQNQFVEVNEKYKLQQEKKKYEDKMEVLDSKKIAIDELISNVDMAQKAMRVVPYIKTFKQTKEFIIKVKKELEIIEIQFKDIKEKKQDVEKRYNIISKNKDELIPKYNVILDNAKEALDLNISLKKEKQDINSLKNKYDKYTNELEIQKSQYKILKDKIAKVNNDIDELDERVSKLNVTNNYRKKVTKGFNLINDIERNKKELLLKDEKSKQLIKNIINQENKIKEVNNILLENEKLLQQKEKEYNYCSNNNIFNPENLLIIQNKISCYKEKWNKYNEYTNSINKMVDENNVYVKQINDYNIKLGKLDELIDKTSNEIRKIDINTLAFKLRESLNESECCPVCGSYEYHIDNIKDINVNKLNTNDLDEKLREYEKEYKYYTNIVLSNNAKVENNKKRIEEINIQVIQLGEDFKEISIKSLEEEFKQKQKLITDNNNKIKILSEEIKIISQSVSTNKSNSNSYKIMLEKEKTNLQTLIDDKLMITTNINDANILLKELFSKENKKILYSESNINKLNNKIKQSYNDDSVIDDKIDIDKNINDNIDYSVIKLKYEQLLKNDELFEKLDNKLKDNRKILLNEENKSKDIEKNISLLNQNIIEINTTIKQKDSLKNNLVESIKNKIGDVEDIDNFIIKTKDNINDLIKEFNNIVDYKNDIVDKYNRVNENNIKYSSKLKELEDKKTRDISELEEAFKEENFKDIDSVRKVYMSKENLFNNIKIIDDYKQQVSKIKGLIDSIVEKIGDKIISEEFYSNIIVEKNNFEKEVNLLNESRIKLNKEIEIFKEKLNDVKNLICKKQLVTHKLALLNDLEKLFKGKKFVEFVAANRLKYISKEANKKLKDISNNKYGLEVDENGKFIIRDYKNGGVIRDASTLSGGETFITSLALALSLSAEIQLKGTAPLELFFLDEGFGTLDDNLLEVVMDSIEKIHNDKLKVGIISHVESIKNRVPIKLILSPSKAGEGGSKVKLEIS